MLTVKEVKDARNHKDVYNFTDSNPRAQLETMFVVIVMNGVGSYAL